MRVAAALGVALCTFVLSSATGFAATDQRLVDAVRRQDAKAVAALIKQRLDVNAPGRDGATPLHWAAHLNDVAIADQLLRAGANAGVTNEYGATPLMLAAENGNGPMIERLIKGGANANAALPMGETALMTAARTGKAEAIKALVAGGANVNAKEKYKGQTPLMWALSEAHVDAARALIAAGADVHARSDSGFTPIMFAVRTGNMDAVTMLIDKGADIHAADNDGSTLLHIATVRGQIDLAKFLLNKGVDPNAMKVGYTAMHYAAGKWDGVDAHDFVEAPGEWNYLKGLRSYQKHDLIKALLAAGANPNLQLNKEPPRYGFSLVSGSAKGYTAGATPFFLAAMGADVDTMRLLASGGANPHIRARNGTTSLMVAAGMAWMENEVPLDSKDYLPATKYAIELGVDVNAVNNTGNSAIHGTISGGFNPVIELLAASGGDVNIKNKRGDTALKQSLGYGAAGGNHVREDTAEVLRKLGGVQ